MVVKSAKNSNVSFFIFAVIFKGECFLKSQITIGLCDVGEFENLPPGTAAQLKY
jgi:hypothetical protein